MTWPDVKHFLKCVVCLKPLKQILDLMLVIINEGHSVFFVLP